MNLPSARTPNHSVPSIRDRLLAYAQLLRLPNVFTAIADVSMGFLVTHGSLQPGMFFGLVLATTSLIYLAGMVLNDVFDVQVDAQDRPERPIPSGRVSLAAAKTWGFGLLGSGVVVSWLLSGVAGTWLPGLVATLLAACVWLYDGLLKSTLAGPILMGTCRLLNVLLGMSLTAGHTGDGAIFWRREEWTIALGIGIYVTGVTLFARSEAQRSKPSQLVLGLGVMLAGMALIAAIPISIALERPLMISNQGWYLFWILLGLIISRRCVLAILHPVPTRVQAAVRNCILSLIVIDAAVCLGFVGPYWGCAVLLLLAPTLILGRWVYST